VNVGMEDTIHKLVNMTTILLILKVLLGSN
jgi:hypothetical protein